MNTLVIGGTGTTGSRVAAALRERGAGLRVATRHPRPDRPDQVRFDWADPATHDPATAEVDRVYLIPPLGAVDPLPVVEPFLTRAVDRGVRRVVLLSSSAVAPDTPGLGALQRAVRDLVPQWAVLRPSWFLQNLTREHVLARGIRERGEIVTATGSGRVALVDADDIAAVAVRALLDPVSHDTDHVITGPRAVDYAEVAETITEVTGRPVRHRSVSAGELTALLVADGMPEPFAAVLAALDETIRDGAEDRVTTTVADLTGRPPRSLREFVTAHRDAFAA
ncbi:uncharacterized protein YbjT (DUF2867 family) [Saccharothrix coeruleofusca]|uniref:ergot alkaloid biosynthesis protein n=1 Tax=Saccharothrix coeruleofusca TaxID=33919 RepID=UPI001AE2AA49|nr:ergot alkaloid biosynthesis protein [Saccharothrix coeruleofusca]MBP2336332.1 uncharacterized protein YbjT (DUF2867 family) [Saccharothrix coeruleofusca]